MSKEKIVKITNVLAILAITLLIYWVFTFVSIKVFGFKIFQSNIMDSFNFSILGILALMAGALMLNIMMNLSMIAENRQKIVEHIPHKSFGKKVYLVFLTFPLIFLFLFYGDYSNSKKTELYMIESVEYIVEEYKEKITDIVQLQPDSIYFEKVNNTIEFLEKQDEKFPSVSFLYQTDFDSDKVIIELNGRGYRQNSLINNNPNLIFSSSKEEKVYLKSVFNNKVSDPLFSANDGKYELYYPVHTKNGTIILFLNKRSRFGKYGS